MAALIHVKQRKRLPQFLGILSCLGLLLLAARPLTAQETTLELDPAKTQISFTLGAVLHSVHGSFQLKVGTIRFNPQTGAASGLVVVDATSGDSDNTSRDRKMHKDVLESGKYPDISFSPTRISGASLQDDSTAQVEGIFHLHGSDHPITLSVPIHVAGSALEVRTHFVVPYATWGLKNPSTLFLRVGDKVDVDVSAGGRLLPVTP